jgi:uncharacterized protein YodC (DUF2158 family)
MSHFVVDPERSRFGIGDYVRLKSGGPVMKIFANRVSGEWRAEQVIVSCRWCAEDGKENEKDYFEYELELDPGE